MSARFYNGYLIVFTHVYPLIGEIAGQHSRLLVELLLSIHDKERTRRGLYVVV